MRKYNALLSVVLVAIFLIHAILSGFVLYGVIRDAGKLLAWVGCWLVVLHAVFGVVLTIQTIKSRSASGKGYLRQNALFWTRRISGVCILVLAFFHFGLYGTMVDDKYVLFEFTALRLLTQLLLSAALFTHIFVNVRP
ncbi:MAG: hypothetical protein LBP28_04965, partial [Coriobacteriales bacterium]|nr:hypothetical protein [Coriobacteriales bacterium]